MVDWYARTAVLGNAEFCCQKYGEILQSGRAASVVTVGWMDHAADARATGAHGITVCNGVELQEELARAVGSPRTAVIDAITDPSADHRLGRLPPSAQTPTSRRQPNLARPPRTDNMTIDDMDDFQQEVAGIRAYERYEFELPRAPDCAVAKASDCVVEGRAQVTAAAVPQVVSQ